jgi:competence ComEA-like helix-hairpin-helix protein
MNILSSLWRCCGIFVLALSLAACKQVPLQNTRPQPLPQDAFVEVYFNHSQASEYIEPYRNQRRDGDNLEQVILDAIATAKSTLDIAVQEFRLPLIAQALADQKKAGVKVRVILENNYSRPYSSLTAAEVEKLPERERDRYQEFRQLVDRNRDNNLTPDEISKGDALIILKNAGIPIIDDTADGSKGSSLMHHKFVIVDSVKVIVTSANFTTSDIHGDFKNTSSLGNANNLLKITSLEIAALFTQEFNIMWGDGPEGKPDSQFGVKKPYRQVQQIQLGNTTVALQFSPTSSRIPWEESSNGLIGKTLNTATQSIDMALFVFSEQRLVDILQTTHQRGVQVRALIDPDFAYRSYSEALDMMGVALANKCKYEPNNRPWENPISTVGVPQLLKGDLLHHKFGLIDNQIVITGSHNWSLAADRNNDETLLIIQSQTVATHFKREFERLYGNALLGIPDGMQRKIKAQQQQCPQIVTASEKPDQNLSQQPQAESQTKVNLNTATQAELETLPGVGPKLAKQIIQARQQKPFTSLEELDKIPGVGSSLLEKLRDRVTW